MNAKHTPGAIRAAEILTGGKYELPDLEHKAKTYSTDYGRKTVYGIADMIDRETAAPDLLAALEDAWRSLDRLANDPDDTNAQAEATRVAMAARAAIAKAEGRAGT